MRALFFILVFGLSIKSYSQVPTLFGLLRTSNPPSVQLGTLDLLTGNYATTNPNSIASSINLTGAALDLNTNNYFFITQGGSNGTMLSVGMNDGLVAAQQMITNPIAPSYFDNFRFNTSDSSLYGLARRFIPAAGGQPGYGELFFASINPYSGVVTQISQQSITDSYSLSGSAIDPHQMIYYFSKGTQFYGIDMYNGQIYSSPTLSFPEGGMYFDNYTYNCADTTIYGIIRVTTTPPITAYLGKVDPSSGVVTRIAQTPLQYNTYSVNGSSTIDPETGVYYYVSSLPQGGVGVIGISLESGLLQSVHPVTSSSGVQTYFDMIRHPSDCYNAEIVRPSSIDGGAGLSQIEQSLVRVYPNPFNDCLQIEADCPIELAILKDLHGKFVCENSQGEASMTMMLNAVSNGIYILEVHTKNGIQKIKLVK